MSDITHITQSNSHLTSCTTPDYWAVCMVIKDRMMGEGIVPLRGFFICQLPGQHDTGTVLQSAERHRLIWVCGQPCVTVYGVLATSFLSIHDQHATSGLTLFVFLYLLSL